MNFETGTGPLCGGLFRHRIEIGAWDSARHLVAYNCRNDVTGLYRAITILWAL